MALASLGAILFAGWLIGATGIGGVLVVPALTRIEGIALPQAVAASAAAFACPAITALIVIFMRRVLVRGIVSLSLGAIPGAMLGATLVHRLDVHILLMFVTALLLFAGLHALRDSWNSATQQVHAELPRWALFVIGSIVGMGSGLTGTGGPVLLSPTLVLLRQPLPIIVTYANIIQMPVAIAATIVHWRSGTLNPWLAATVGLALLIASVLGQIAGALMNTHVLQRLVAVLLLGTGLWFMWTLFV